MKPVELDRANPKRDLAPVEDPPIITEEISEVVKKEELNPLTLPVLESTEDEVVSTGIVPDESDRADPKPDPAPVEDPPIIAEEISEVVKREEPNPLTLPVLESTEDEVDSTGIVSDESEPGGSETGPCTCRGSTDDCRGIFGGSGKGRTESVDTACARVD